MASKTGKVNNGRASDSAIGNLKRFWGLYVLVGIVSASTVFGNWEVISGMATLTERLDNHVELPAHQEATLAFINNTAEVISINAKVDQIRLSQLSTSRSFIVSDLRTTSRAYERLKSANNTDQDILDIYRNDKEELQEELKAIDSTIFGLNN